MDRQTNGRTDRRTLHDSIDRACIASRGKNILRLFFVFRLLCFSASVPIVSELLCVMLEKVSTLEYANWLVLLLLLYV